jgi:tetratricopeptide (TPR) repeat protein
VTKLAVANALREVGEVAEARKLAQATYDNEPDASLKQGAASVRALLWLDLDDRILWLKRGNLSDPETKAALSTALGDNAFRKGQDQEAAEHYREAVRLYESLPESPAALNNCAVAYFALYAVTRDQPAQDKAIANQEKALALRPGDSIVLRNVASTMQANALRGIIGQRIDVTLLRRSGSLQLLPYLWSDGKTRAHYRELLRTSGAIAKARTHFERLRVLAPKSTSAYEALSRLHEQTRDLAALRDLHRHLQEAALDLADYRRHTFDHLQGKDDEKVRADLASALPRIQEQLQMARKVGGPTLAVALGDLVAIRIAADWLGDAVDANEVVALAEEAHQAAPSRGSEGLKQSAWLLRAHQTLSKQEPFYAKFAAQARRSVSSAHAIAIALSPESPVRDACRANADVQRTIHQIQAQLKLFPQDGDAWDWAMLRGTYPEEAARIAERLKNDDLARLERAIAFRLAPLSAHEAYHQHWLHLIDGDRQKAAAVLQELVKEGIPIPVLGE